MRQRPRLASHVSTERMRTVSMPDSSISMRRLFVDQLPGLDEDAGTPALVALVRIFHFLRGHVADDALGERLDDVLAFLQRADLEALDRAAILFA